MVRPLLLAAALLLCSRISAQDTTDTESNGSTDTAQQHSPTTATIRSAMLPGLGQIYNKKYWKVPVIYAGLGASGYFIVRNTRQYNEFRDALIARNDPDATDAYQGIYTEQQLNTIKSTYRRWRDLSYISFIAVYVLQVVDANVDAHLYDFDVSDDLSLRLAPWSGGCSANIRSLSTGKGLSFSLRF